MYMIKIYGLLKMFTLVRLNELYYIKFFVSDVTQGVSFIVLLNTTVLSHSKPHPPGHPTTAAVMTGATKGVLSVTLIISDSRKFRYSFGVYEWLTNSVCIF